VVVIAKLVAYLLVVVMSEPVVMLEPVVVIVKLEVYGLMVVMMLLLVYALVLPLFCAADDEGCSIKICAIALRSKDAEGCRQSSTISRLCHRVVEPRHSPRQC
jgi:hypothetical protein